MAQQPPWSGAPSYQPPSAWQQPQAEAGPAPGVAFAGFGIRLIAYIIDAVVAAFAGGVLVVADIALLVAVPALGLLGILGLFIAYVCWFPYWWHSGATPGMRMTGLRVVRDVDGGPIGWGAAFLRLIGWAVSSMVFYLGFVWIFIDNRRRGWHDLIAGTLVVKLP